MTESQEAKPSAEGELKQEPEVAAVSEGKTEESKEENGPAHSPYNTGRWTDQEHEDFIKGLRSYGKNWDMLAYSVKTRSATQVRSHAQKFFLKCASKYKRKVEPEYVSLKQNTAVLGLCMSSSKSNSVPRLEGTYTPQYETLPVGAPEPYRSQHHAPRSNYTWSQCQSQEHGHSARADTSSLHYPTKRRKYGLSKAVDSIQVPSIRRYSSLLSELSLHETETKESNYLDALLNSDYVNNLEPLPYNRDFIHEMTDSYSLDYSQTELLI